MVRVLLKISTVILFLILLSSRAYAISIGSVVKNDFAEISNYESTRFKMLFWNIESESYTMKLSIQDAPKDWIIILDPDEFVLNKSIGEEYISLPYIKENIKAKVVNLFVKPKNNSEPRKYLVKIKAEPELTNEKNSVTIVPKRIFNFEIELKGFNNTNSNNVTENQKDVIGFSGNGFDSEGESLKTIDSRNGKQIDKKYFYFVIAIVIILISIKIYKK